MFFREKTLHRMQIMFRWLVLTLGNFSLGNTYKAMHICTIERNKENKKL